jgi:hypothetical protein
MYDILKTLLIISHSISIIVLSHFSSFRRQDFYTALKHSISNFLMWKILFFWEMLSNKKHYLFSFLFLRLQFSTYYAKILLLYIDKIIKFCVQFNFHFGDISHDKHKDWNINIFKHFMTNFENYITFSKCAHECKNVFSLYFCLKI